MTDISGNSQWTYDNHGRVSTKQQTIGSVVRTLVYGSNSAGQLTQITTPSGQAIGYGYTNNRITSVTVNGTTLLNQVLYEPFGPTRGWTWGNGTLAVRDYNTDWQLVTIDSAGLSTYTFFPDGTIQTRTDDNPASFGVPNGTTNYTPAITSNRLTSSSGVQARAYGYDAAGNTTSYTGAAFTFNDAGRMVTATSGGVTTSYLFNALGQRVRKSSASSTRVFAYDELRHITGEYDQTGTLVQEIVWLGDIPVAALRPNGASVLIYYVHTDHLNTPRRITRPSDNTILWRWESDPFAQATANEDVDGDGQIFGFNMRFPGQYFDAETGLSYNYFRDYDSAIGRYVQSDPIGLDGGINTYAYAEANPISYADALGLCAASPNMKRCLEKIFGSPVDSVRVRNKKVFRNNFVTTRRNSIRLPPSFPCESFWGDPRLVLHEYYHVLRQWNLGALSRRGYAREWLKNGSGDDNRFEDEANKFADDNVEEFKKCLADPCSPSGN